MGSRWLTPLNSAHAKIDGYSLSSVSKMRARACLRYREYADSDGIYFLYISGVRRIRQLFCV